MMDLIKACETESELDFLQESFILTNEQKEAVLQQRITIWTNVMADDIEQGNVFDGLTASRMENVQQGTVFGDLMANWTEEQRCRFIVDWTNDEGLVDFDSQPQEGHGMKRPHENEPETSNKRQKDDDYFTIKSAKQVSVRKFNTTGTHLYVLMLGYKLYFHVSEARFVINECFLPTQHKLVQAKS